MLKNFPIELLEQIVSHIDHTSPPPSTGLLHEPPSDAIFTCASNCHLKSFSLTCKALRRSVVQKLWKHLKVSPDAVHRLMDFRLSRHLMGDTQSLMLYLNSKDYPEVEISDIRSDRMVRMRAKLTWMVDMINPRTLTIVAAPSILGWLIDHPVTITGYYLFRIPYQVVQLEQGSFTPSLWFPNDVVHDNHTISTVRPWNHCTYNEGSFGPAYNTYDYHLSIPLSLHQPPNWSELECHALQLSCLTTFQLVAVFPFNHRECTCFFLAATTEP